MICRGCGRPIRFAYHAALGRMIPVDPDMRPGGHLTLARPDATSAPIAHEIPKPSLDIPGYNLHTCNGWEY